MSDRSRTRQESGSLRFEIGLFVAFLGVFAFFLVVPLFAPKVFYFIWEGSLGLAYQAFTWVWTPELVLLLFVMIGLVVAINILIWLKKLYLYLFSRDPPEDSRDDWNDYRIK